MNGCRLKFWTKVHHLPSSLVETGTWRQCKGSLLCFVCSLAHVDLCNSLILMLLLWMKSMLPTVAGTAFFPWCPSQQSVCLCAYICVLSWHCVWAHDHVCAFHYEYSYYCFFVWLYYTIDFYVGICTVHVFLKLGCKALWVSESTL